MTLEKSRYLLVFRIEFEAIDNMEARMRAKELAQKITFDNLPLSSLPNVTLKLQKLQDKGPPLGIGIPPLNDEEDHEATNRL